jgi:hypothetical protein
VQSVSIKVPAAQYLAGWREQARILFLPTLSECRVGDLVAVRIAIHGGSISATLFGKVSLVRRVGRPALPPGIELQIERHSLAAAAFLAMAARGEKVTFKERLPRFSHERALTVRHGETSLELTTLNVSDDGCALRWPGALPAAGDQLVLKLGDGLFAATIRGVVCWTQSGPDGQGVGVRIVVEGRGGRAWRSLAESVARSGAHAS